MDKSFEGLLISVILHILLVVALVNAKLTTYLPEKPTEITLIERPTSKTKSFVTETQKKEPFEELKDQADFLSQFTKRVKKQMRALNNGPTQNAEPKQVIPVKPQQEQSKRIAGMQRKSFEGEGIGNPAGGQSQAMRNVAIGQSTIAEYIPGIEEGDFTALNTDQFTYYTFFARMNEQVRNRWVSNVRAYMARITAKDLEFLSRMERHTMVEIILSPDGQFQSSVIQQTSGDKDLDLTTVQAFREAAPFNNPPRGMVEADGFIHLRYGFVVHFRPPNFGPAG